MIIGMIVLGVIGLALVAVIGIYNGLVQKKIKVDEALADIDTFLKQRFDMIPNLVEIAKGYMKHEKETLTKVVELRSAISKAGTVKEKSELDNQLSGTLKSLFAVAENYPDLKANKNFVKLQDQLTELENKIQMSRRYYNASVRDYNTAVQVFPQSVVASILGFKAREYFEAAENEKKNVKVDFS